MSDMKILMESACIVCTKDRPDEIRVLLMMLSKMAHLPRVVVIVDSSETDLTELEVCRVSSTFPTELKFIRSLPGAPHQKNIGLEYLASKFNPDELISVSLIDDDVELPSEYFENVQKLISLHPSAACIGGFDVLNPVPRGGLFRHLAGLAGGPEKQGRILKSGIALPPMPHEDLQPTVWVPGFTQNFPWHLARHQRFDGRVRIYGDEVEFQLRLSQFGQIFVAKVLGVKHLSSVKEKDNYRDQQAYMDAFRWSLAKRYPQTVSAPMVIFTTVCLALGELFRVIFLFKRVSWKGFMGHLDFLHRLSTGKPTQQYVTHYGSGPFTDLQRT